MTTFSLPNKGFSPELWRVIYRVPPVARFETVGTFCPLDDSLLTVRSDGWSCPRCFGSWDFRGLRGRWLQLPGAAQPAPRTHRVLEFLLRCRTVALRLVRRREVRDAR